MTLAEKIIKPKLGVLELAKQLGNVSQACKTMGYSRDSFYRYKKLYETGGDEALHEFAVRARVGRADRDDGVLGFRELAHFERHHGAQPEQQDHQADHGRQHRPADEDIGESAVHGAAGVTGASGAIATAMSLRSLF